MKASLVIAAVILAGGVLFGWKDHRQLVRLREEHHLLVSEAQRLGIATAGGDQTTGSRSGRLARELAEAEQAEQARAFAAEVIAFARDTKAAEKTGGLPPDEAHQRVIRLLDGLLSLDPDQFGVLVDEIRRSPDLDDEMRRNMVSFSIMMLANDHPEAAIALFSRSADLYDGSDRGRGIVAGALQKWASRDPMAALEWIRSQGATHPELVTDDTRRGIVGGAAQIDPRLAFNLMGELGIEDVEGAVRTIAQSAQSPGQRAAVLGALRSHLESIADAATRDQLTRSTLRDLGGRVSSDGFDSSMEWLSDNSLSTTETAAFAEGLNRWSTRDDTGRWIEWLDGKLPDARRDEKVRELVSQWTREDYAAAGSWLNGSADGPTREPAVRAYAETVAPYEPATAANWALTLPPGSERTALLKQIHGQWKQQDEAAAAEFAERHGFK